MDSWENLTLEKTISEKIYIFWSWKIFFAKMPKNSFWEFSKNQKFWKMFIENQYNIFEKNLNKMKHFPIFSHCFEIFVLIFNEFFFKNSQKIYFPGTFPNFFFIGNFEVPIFFEEKILFFFDLKFWKSISLWNIFLFERYGCVDSISGLYAVKRCHLQEETAGECEKQGNLSSS